MIAGQVDRIVHPAHEAEVLVRTGGATWIASVVSPALAALALTPGVDVLSDH